MNNELKSFLLSLLLVPIIAAIIGLIIFFKNKIDNLKEIKKTNSTNVIKLENGSYHIIISGSHFRLIFEESIYPDLKYKLYNKCNIFNFPNGTKYLSTEPDYNFILKSVMNFEYLEEVNERKKLFEKEIIAELSSPIDDWDEKFSFKQLNKG